MKPFIYLLLFISSLSVAQPSKISEDPVADGYFILNKTIVRFENNFILNDDKKNYDGIPNLLFKDYYFTVLGKILNIKITGIKDYNQLQIKGQIYLDSLKAHKDLYRIENLEVQVLKNNKIVKNWASVIQTKSYTDSLYNFLGKKDRIENGYLPYADSLINGDKLVVLFRKKGQESFLKWHFEKKESARRPFIILSNSYDIKKGTNFENFIIESLDKIRRSELDKSNFYDDWPEDFAPRIIGNTNRHFKNEKFCLVFRKPNGKKRTQDSFEYRSSIDSKTGEWIKSNGIIFLDLKESGTQYKLEVRYKDDPKYIAVYKYSTEPDWYQKLWFKISFGMIFLLIFSVVYIIWIRKIAERKRLEQKSKIKMLYAQLNPHFVFNALGSIQGLLNDNQIEKANQYLAGFGSLLRNTLNSTESETQSLEKEIKSINNYIELEQLRNPFLYHLTIDKEINVHETQILPLLIQPLMENAVKHGISNKENAELTISISKQTDDLIFEIIDNGKGFDILAEQKGFGLKLVKDRITLFNQSSKKTKIDIKIESNSSGTQITICYKNWLKND